MNRCAQLKYTMDLTGYIVLGGVNEDRLKVKGILGEKDTQIVEKVIGRCLDPLVLGEIVDALRGVDGCLHDHDYVEISGDGTG